MREGVVKPGLAEAGLRRIPPSLAGWALILMTLDQAAAQDAYTVTGRVVDSEGNRGIPNAIVGLDGQRPTLTRNDGAFLLAEVGAGTYVLRVQAFGYEAVSRVLRVQADVTSTVELPSAPFRLDSLVVAPREVDVRGEVRDPERDLPLDDAEVYTSEGDATRTNARGKFDVRGWEGIGLLVQIRAFGYLPVDSVLDPSPDDDVLFELVPDPVVERMITAEIRRIEERAGGRRAITLRPLNRDDLLRRRGRTLHELLSTEYGHRVSLGCVAVDERVLAPSMADAMLRTTFVQDVERVEFLFRGRMLRVYTRAFIRTMLGGGVELGHVSYVDMARPPFCT